MNVLDKKSKNMSSNFNSMNIISTNPRRILRSRVKRQPYKWPRENLEFELYAFNYSPLVKGDSNSNINGITEDILNKQFGLRATNNNNRNFNDIIFRKDDEVVGFEETRFLDTTYSLNYKEYINNPNNFHNPGQGEMFELSKSKGNHYFSQRCA